MNESISLSEKLYLLSIHPQKGGIISAARTASDYVILGSLFLELYLSRKVRIDKKRIVLLNSKSEDKIHQFLLEKIARTDRNLKVGRWFNKFYFSLKHIRERVQHNLSEKRIIRMQEKHFLFFRWKSPVIINRQLIYHLVDDIDRIIFKGSEAEEDLLLILMLQPARLTRRVFTSKDKREEAEKRLNEIIKKMQISSSHADAFEAVNSISTTIKRAVAAQHTVA